MPVGVEIPSTFGTESVPPDFKVLLLGILAIVLVVFLFRFGRR